MQEEREIYRMSDWYAISKENPEWKLARYEGAEQERSIWYHGTKESNLKSILSQGLIADPKAKAWDEDQSTSFHSPSRVSVGGVYVTRSLLTARIAATHNIARGESRTIVIMELQPRSLVADEDSLTAYVKSILNGPKYNAQEWHIGELFMANALSTNAAYVKQAKDEYIEIGLRLLEKQYGPLHPKLHDRIQELLEGNWEIVLNRQAAYVEKYQWKASFYRNISPDMKQKMDEKYKQIDISSSDQSKKDEAYSAFVESLVPKQPDRGQFESEYSNFMNQITRTVKQVARPSKNPQPSSSYIARSTENIGFKGVNKIVSIVTIDSKDNVVLNYGTIPDDFKDQWATTYGELKMEKEKKMDKAASITKLAEKSIWYHGTEIGNYSKITSEGLLANPPDRAWDDTYKGDPIMPSHASLQGVYLTHELLDALEAPDSAIEAKEVVPTDKSVLLAIVQADTQSVYIDEDAIAFDIGNAVFNASDYLISRLYLSGLTGIDQPYFDRIQNKYVEEKMEKMEIKFDLSHPSLSGRVKQILHDGFPSALIRQVGYVEEEVWKRAYEDIVRVQKNYNNLDSKDIPDIPDIPTVLDGERAFRTFMEQMTKTLNFPKHKQEKDESNGEWWESGRYPENITFSGSTKIIALINITVRSNKKDVYLDPHEYRYQLLYGEIPQQFLNDWEKLSNWSKTYGYGDVDEKISPPAKQEAIDAYEDWYNKTGVM